MNRYFQTTNLLISKIVFNRFESQWSQLNNILKWSTQTYKVLFIFYFYYIDLNRSKYSVEKDFLNLLWSEK